MSGSHKTEMRSGGFQEEVRVGKWTPYDKAGALYKITLMKTQPTARVKKPARSERGVAANAVFKSKIGNG